MRAAGKHYTPTVISVACR